MPSKPFIHELCWWWIVRLYNWKGHIADSEMCSAAFPFIFIALAAWYKKHSTPNAAKVLWERWEREKKEEQGKEVKGKKKERLEREIEDFTSEHGMILFVHAKRSAPSLLYCLDFSMPIAIYTNFHCTKCTTHTNNSANTSTPFTLIGFQRNASQFARLLYPAPALFGGIQNQQNGIWIDRLQWARWCEREVELEEGWDKGNEVERHTKHRDRLAGRMIGIGRWNERTRI